MQSAFMPITLEQQSAYQRYLNACPQAASDYSFINLYGWADEYQLEWAWQPDLVWIRQQRPHPAWWAPVGNWAAIDWPERIQALPSDARQWHRTPSQLTQMLVDRIPRVEWTPQRGHWDYLYAVEDLRELKGNRYHKKKNLLNQFLRRQTFTYRPLRSDLTAQALGLQASWCTWQDCESEAALDAENRVIVRLLSAWDQLAGLMGGVIDIGERLVAYTLAEELTADMVVIHIEKADPEIKGAYQAINHQFLDHAPRPWQVVNREQDLDDPGLRQAKLSYQPIGFIEKMVVLLPD